MSEPKIDEKQSDEKGYGLGIRHLLIGALSLTSCSLFVVRSIMGIAVLAMTDQRRASNLEVYPWDKRIQGLILSSFFWGYTLMQIPAGLLAKRFGGKPILLFALTANGVIALLTPLLARVGGWPMVCACRVATGLTQACLFPSCHTLLGRWLPSHERTTLSGLVFGASTLGIISSFPVSGLLAETSLGWKLIFYVSGCIMLFVAFLWWLLTASTPDEHKWISQEEVLYIQKHLPEMSKKSLKVPWLQIFKCKGFWAINVAHLASATVFVSFLVELPTYLEKGLNMTLTKSASISSFPYIGMMFGTTLSTYVADLLVNHGYISLGTCRKMFTTIALSGTVIGLGALIMVDTHQQSLVIFSLIFTLTAHSTIVPGFLVNHLDLSPNYGGILMSMTNFSSNIGSILAPIVTSVILRNDPTDVSRWRLVFAEFAAISIIGNLVYVIFGTAERQEWDDPNYLDKKKAHPEEMKSIIATATK